MQSNFRRIFAVLAFIFAFVSVSFGDETVKWSTQIKDGKVVITGTPDVALQDIHGTIEWISCYDNQCHSPETADFGASVDDEPQTGAAQESAALKEEIAEKASRTDTSLWALLIEAVIWGLAMLLTPCVFPMVPMTISFFIKQSAGRFKAFIFGLFIVLLYTVPVSLIIGATWLVGGPAVSADIFNVFSTHWLPNVIFFIVFMLFAASFFGAFEIVLPASWTNSADRNSDKKGLVGVFFFALTLVLVSFSCTGPIVGTILIKSISGEIWVPMLTMLVFSATFALPFTILALFPSLLDKLPKSGGWLNSVKVVLGFVEIALGLKFLSVADQVYHWGILSRGLYISIWIVCSVLMGIYLLGKLRFRNDSEIKSLSVTRLVLAICSFVFALYLLPGLFGAPLKALSGYLPPMDDSVAIGTSSGSSTSALFRLESDYDNLDDALASAAGSGRPILVNVTGYGCTNCREMEAKVLSDPAVRELMSNYIIVSLHVDGKKTLPEDRWITNDAGKVLKKDGQISSYIALKRFGVNAQPNYILLNSKGEQLAPARAYDLDIEGYKNFLKIGL